VTYKGKLPRSVRFFVTEAGNEPVREWLKGLSKEQKQTIGEEINLSLDRKRAYERSTKGKKPAQRK
jgi:hypothetical protein